MLTYDSRIPQIVFAAAEIEEAADMTKCKGAVSPYIEIVVDPKGLSPQGYRMERLGEGQIRVVGGDANGAMYGGLDVAEAIRLGTLDELGEEHVPYIAQRGIKFNIPLDLRTPSYSDNGDAAQANIPEMWSMEFWREFLDEMARNRFNVLSLWNLHPFPSLVKVPEFPDVALNDVWRTRAKLDDKFSMSGRDMLQPYMLDDHEVVKQISIEEKIDFWREVMQYAKERGIDVYWFTWNIFVWSAEGKHGITGDGNNPATIAYFRASVREMVRAYPLLAGIGITAGENVHSLAPNKEEGRKSGKLTPEEWLWKTYGEGVRDAVEEEPGRQFRLIHRFHMAAQDEVLDAFKDYPGPFDLSYKYSVAHMLSMTNPPFLKPVLEQMPEGMRTWLTVRNDDIYRFRWGDADFARDYIRAMPGPDRLAGFYMGPDGYVWGREFADVGPTDGRDPEEPQALYMKKMWFYFMLWGRLSYDPDLPNAHFERALGGRFPEAPAGKLMEASATASKIIPQTTRFFWKNIDLIWFPEACVQRIAPEGFYSVKDFINGYAMPEAGILNIREWRERLSKGKLMGGITPPEVAEILKGYGARTLELVAEMRPCQGDNEELRLTLGDYEAMGHLGNYYAEKILGACDLALAGDDDAERKASAVRHMEVALEHWKRYAAVAAGQYKPQRFNRIGYVDLHELTGKAEEDIAIARNWSAEAFRAEGDGSQNHGWRPGVY